MLDGSYGGLLTAIKRWTWDRNDLSDVGPDCVALAEADLNNILRVAQMEAESTVTLTAGVGTLPTDYLMWRRVMTQDSPIRVLQWAEPNWAEDRYSPLVTALSNHFTIVGSTIKTYPLCVPNLTLRYYQKLPPLAANITGNWLSQRHPGIYLYSSLVHLAPFLDDDERIQTWGAMRKTELEQLIDADKLARYAKPVQRPDAPTP